MRHILRASFWIYLDRRLQFQNMQPVLSLRQTYWQLKIIDVTAVMATSPSSQLL